MDVTLLSWFRPLKPCFSKKLLCVRDLRPPQLLSKIKIETLEGRYSMRLRNLLMAFVFLHLFGLTDLAKAEWECMGPPASCISNKNVHKFSRYRKYERSYTQQKTTYRSEPRQNFDPSYSTNSSSRESSLVGMASYYWQGQRVASGGMFNPNALTAAHKTLPFGTKVLVTNKTNGRSVTVTINDRGPYIRGRIIDLSKAAASEIGMLGSGVAPVSVAIVD